MAAVSNRPVQSVWVNLGADDIRFSYYDDDTVGIFRERVAGRTAFSADELELYAHYQPTQWWHYCCGDVSEKLDNPNALLKDLMQDVSHISLKVFAKVKVSSACDCRHRELP